MIEIERIRRGDKWQRIILSLGVVYPGVTATNFYSNLAGDNQPTAGPLGATSVDSAEFVAEKILEAVETQAAEVYADNLKKALFS